MTALITTVITLQKSHGHCLEICWPWICLLVSMLFLFFGSKIHTTTSQVALVVKNLPANTGDVRDVGLIPGSGRSLGGGQGNPLQYSWLENPMDRGAWQTTVHGVAKSQTQLKRLSTRMVSLQTVNVHLWSDLTIFFFLDSRRLC